jgi:uncharacterized protein YkwD
VRYALARGADPLYSGRLPYNGLDGDLRKAALTLVVGGLLQASPAHGQVSPPPQPKLPATSALPQLLSVQVHQPGKDERESTVRVRAVDQTDSVSGVAVRFSDGEAFGISACRAPDSAGRPPGPPFTPGSKVTFSIPHRFRVGDLGSAFLQIDASGCLGSVNSLYQPFLFSSGPPAAAASSAAAARRRHRHRDRHGHGRSYRRGGCARVAVVRRSRRSLRLARRALLCALNAVRRRRGLRPLRSNRRLLRAASRHSRRMVLASFFSHIEPAGIGLVQRVRGAGYFRGAQSWLVGENIGFGRGRAASPARMVRAWMGSTGHRANILAPQFREVGIGITAGTPGSPGGRGATYTTDFGVKR